MPTDLGDPGSLDPFGGLVGGRAPGVVCPVESSFGGGEESYGFVFWRLEDNIFRGVFWREIRAAGLIGSMNLPMLSNSICWEDGGSRAQC